MKRPRRCQVAGNSRVHLDDSSVIKVNLDDDLAAYDALPRVVRDQLKYSPSDYAASGLGDTLDRSKHIPNVSELLAALMREEAHDKHRKFMEAEFGRVPEDESPRRYVYV